MGGWGEGWWNQFPIFDAESKLAKIQNSHVEGGGGCWWNQFPTFDAESKLAKIQNSHVEGWGGGWWNQFPTFDAEFEFAKIQNSHVKGGNQFPTFDAEFKFAKIQNSHVEGGWVAGGRVGGTNFQFLMQSLNLLKSKIPMSRVGGGCWWNQFPTFDAESKFALKKNFFCEKFSKFSGKKVPGNGFGL